MNQFFINGVERTSPLSAEKSFKDLIDYVHQLVTSETALISSVRVDGNELTDLEDENLSSGVLSEIRSVEIFTSHPKEIAEETLQTLIQFCDGLIVLSREVAAQKSSDHRAFHRLIDGITTLTESILSVKKILKVGALAPVDLVEADLLSILNDVLHAYQVKDSAYLNQLLDEYLPKNLTEWATAAIPALIRSRDS